MFMPHYILMQMQDDLPKPKTKVRAGGYLTQRQYADRPRQQYENMPAELHVDLGQYTESPSVTLEVTGKDEKLFSLEFIWREIMDVVLVVRSIQKHTVGAERSIVVNESIYRAMQYFTHKYLTKHRRDGNVNN